MTHGNSVAEPVRTVGNGPRGLCLRHNPCRTFAIRSRARFLARTRRASIRPDNKQRPYSNSGDPAFNNWPRAKGVDDRSADDGEHHPETEYFERIRPCIRDVPTVLSASLLSAEAERAVGNRTQ